MDWKQILSLSNEDLDDERKESIYMELIKDQKFDSKTAKKILPVCVTILKFKGQQVEKQREEIEMLASSDIDLKSTLEQVEKQKKMVSKYEVERVQFKNRIKELQEEIAMTHSRELKGSDDEDSPDQLSEIDRTQELLAKLSAKNKHIKRLFRDIEQLEQQSAVHINVITSLKAELEDKEESLSLICNKYEETAGMVSLLEEKIVHLSCQLHEQVEDKKQLLESHQHQEKELEKFSRLIEERVRYYKTLMDEKQRDLDEMKEKYESLVEQVPGIDVDSEGEVKRLVDSIRERDDVIRELEERLQLVSSELMDSTEVIDKIGREREESFQNASLNKNGQCCAEYKNMLQRANERCHELREIMEATEADNVLKAKQAFDAIEALKSYENNTDGLADALRKIHKLQEAIHQREKQIEEFVIELNAQNEIVAENAVLRRRLGIPEEEIIETKGFLAKQKRFAKVNDRLMLKLRASEEMRLQLKIEKNDLKRKIDDLQARLNGGKISTNNRLTSSSSVTTESSVSVKFDSKNPKVEMKECENCHVSYNVYESLKFCRTCIIKQQSNFCDNCTANVKIAANENVELVKKIAKLEIDHQSLVDENEKLRDGLNDILWKLSDFEANAQQSIISTATLEKLLFILNSKSEQQKSLKTSRASENQSEVSYSQPNLVFSSSTTEKDPETFLLTEQIKTLEDENETLKLNLERTDLLKAQYEELVRTSELSDDDKYKLLIKSLERCHEFESNLVFYERKFDFLLEENDKLNLEIRALKVASVELKTDLKMEALEKSSNLNEESRENVDELFNIQLELQQVRTELNGFCTNILKNIKSIDEENILKIDTEKLSQIAILEPNLSTNFITRNELDALKANLNRMQETIKSHEAKEKHFEEIAKVAQQQLKSQQLMLSQFSDDEIVARHLIVDLQSQSNENYLLAKTVRDLKISKDNEDRLRLENENLKGEISTLEEYLRNSQAQIDERFKELTERENNNKLKIQYLRKTLLDLCNQYSSMTPVYLISDFIKHYVALLEARKQFDVKSIEMKTKSSPEVVPSQAQLKELSLTGDIEAKIEIIKHKSSCDYLKEQLRVSEVTIKELHNEIARIKTNEIKNMQHWNTIRMLFGNNDDSEINEKVLILKFDKEVQAEPSKNDCGTITDEISQVPESTKLSPPSTPIKTSEDPRSSSSEITVKTPAAALVSVDDNSDDQKSLQMQLKKALILASSRSSLLIETENRLSEAQGRIKVLEKNLENQHKQNRAIEQKQQQQQADEMSPPRKDDHILSMTISTLQNLILEKDTTLSRYQELLKSERQHNIRTFDNLSDEIKQLKKAIDGHENVIAEKERIIEKLKRQIEELKEESAKLQITLDNQPQTSPPPPPPTTSSQPQSSHHVTFSEHDIELRSVEIKLKEAQNEVKSMEQQIKDLTNVERQLQAVIRERDVAIKELNIKLKASNDNVESLTENFTSNAEIDQLRDMLEEKDKHIQDLTDTLNQFHDDQQKYINDTAINSAEHVHLISTDLARAEATNRILKTQLEALKRQLHNVQQREKQSRDMIKTLKNQLIRRPVFSLTSDKRPASSSREEQLQKRSNELENELRETKDELRRQTNINDNKKAKNAAELGLWDKQKRYQEMAEKLKTKLTEKEIDYERLKASLQIAKNTITRLEKEKIMLENKIKSGRYMQSVSNANIGHASHYHHQHSNQQKHLETTSLISDTVSDINHELINALKARIESQQRRIVSMELEGKGSNVYATEIERMQEDLSAIQAANIRLEARNVQLQLDYDLMRQNQNGQRQEERIKHLESYILVLKDEIAQAHAKVDSPEKHKPQHEPSLTAHVHAMEQTIIKLKRIVEKLQVENKYLKGNSSSRQGTASTNITTATYMNQNDRKKEEIFEKLKCDYEKLQKSHTELLSKISAMQIELELSQAQSVNVSCPHCNNMDELATQDIDVLRQQLQHKTALLDKARILLQRAAGKEKHLLEKINYLKKKVSELEGVPVISEENSEYN